MKKIEKIIMLISGLMLICGVIGTAALTLMARTEDMRIAFIALIICFFATITLLFLGIALLFFVLMHAEELKNKQ